MFWKKKKTLRLIEFLKNIYIQFFNIYFLNNWIVEGRVFKFYTSLLETQDVFLF